MQTQTDLTALQDALGDMADALASLNTHQQVDVTEGLAHWLAGHSVRATAPKILAKTLELVIEATKLEVPDVQA